MVGLIHRLLLDMLRRDYGSKKVARLLSMANLTQHQEFRLDTNYSDLEFQRLFTIILNEIPLTQAQLESKFAVHFLADALKRWPAFFQMSTCAKSFLERQPRIHNGFASSMTLQCDRDKINDKFHLESTENTLIVHYKSPHQLCGLYIALVKEVLEHYDEEALITENQCLKHGDAECCISVQWEVET